MTFTSPLNMYVVAGPVSTFVSTTTSSSAGADTTARGLLRRTRTGGTTPDAALAGVAGIAGLAATVPSAAPLATAGTAAGPADEDDDAAAGDCALVAA